MIIGIDVSSVPYGTGVSNYTTNLVKHLAKIDKVNTYKLLFYSFRQKIPSDITTLCHQPNFHLYHYRLPPLFFEIIWNRLHIFPVELFIGHCDLFHTWEWTQPPTLKAKTITTIHDLVPLIFPETLHPKIVSNFQLKMKLALKECRHFICVSQNTADDFRQFYPQISPAQVTVIPEAAEDKYLHFYNMPEDEKIDKINHFKKLYDLNRFVLTQGTREPRKNLNRLIAAFIKYKQIFPKSKIELAISGKYGWGNDIDHIQHPYIKILGYIPEKDMVLLHASAFCLAVPSLYEGFGLPILKSFSVGVPVITSNLSSLPEVAGNAAILIQPKSVDAIFQALKLILHDSHLRNRLIDTGFSQLKKFSWTKTATETLVVYHQVNSL